MAIPQNFESSYFQVGSEHWFKLAVREGEEDSAAWDTIIQSGLTDFYIGKVGNNEDALVRFAEMKQITVSGHVVIIARLQAFDVNTDFNLGIRKLANAPTNSWEPVIDSADTANPAVAFWPYLYEKNYNDYNGVLVAFLADKLVVSGGSF